MHYSGYPGYQKLRAAKRWHQKIKEQKHFLTPGAKRALRQSSLDVVFSYDFLSRVGLGRRNAELSRLGDKAKRDLKALGAEWVGDIEKLNPATVASLLNTGPGTLAFMLDFLTAFGLQMSDDAPHMVEDTLTIGAMGRKLADRLKLPPATD